MPEVHDEPGTPGTDDRAALRALADRLPVGDLIWEEPPADLWDRIAAETGVAPDAGSVGPPASEVHDAVPQPVLIDRRGRRAARRPVFPWLLAAAAAIVVIVGAVVMLNRSPAPTVVASAALERLGPSGSGDVELVDDDGALRLKVNATGVEAGGGFLELWVIDSEVRKLVSLGPLRADGVYDLPPGLEPKQFPIVDVSVEPLDGNPAHSSDSVLRGELQF